MRVAVATVKDTSEHVERFVATNLAGGLDHLVVCLDAPGAEGQPEVRAELEAHPRVSVVRAGREWWGGARPASLNERQCTNANAVREALAMAPAGPHWLFHVDGDEAVRLDPAAWAELPDDAVAVRLAVREAVSKRSWDGEPTLWKRPLDEGDLGLLHTLRAIAEPTDQALFHGHLMGKSGLRTDGPGRFTLHRVVDHAGRALQAHADPRLRLFHYESYSGADFVRKWTAMVGSGPPASYRPGRAGLARALRALLAKDLPAPVREKYLMRLYERSTLDDVETLSATGVLDEVDPRTPVDPDAGPAADPSGTVSALEDGLEALRGAPKGHLFLGASVRA